MNNLGASGRGSDLHKSALGNIGANDDINLEYSEYNIPESKNKMQDRNSWVLTKGPIPFVQVSLPVSQNATLVKILGNIINNLGHQNFQKMAT